jgi:hypothetical protein
LHTIGVLKDKLNEISKNSGSEVQNLTKSLTELEGLLKNREAELKESQNFNQKL